MGGYVQKTTMKENQIFLLIYDEPWTFETLLIAFLLAKERIFPPSE